MRTIYFIIACILFQYNGFAQREYHVFPVDDKITPGTPNGMGSREHPWDLQTALNQTSKVKGGDVIWLHKGVYNGLYISLLSSIEKGKYITVSSYKSEKVILNGNVSSPRNNVLQVKGKQVIFKDFEVTCLGDFSRNEVDSNFKRINGIDHASGMDCRFENLKIYNVPGLGFGSWKNTGGSKIENCIIYNNGYIAKNGRGTGVGIYVQNNSERKRIIKSNTIFNNYYKGIEVWSANKNSMEEYVKNVVLDSNILFNNGSPSGVFKDNLIVATGDRNGKNIAKNITITNNVFYHNTNVAKNEVGGDGASLTIGFNGNAPVENVKVHNNIIIGRNNALRILHAKKLSFRNNISYAGYVHFFNSVVPHLNSKNWDFDHNTYYTKNSRVYRISKYKDFTFNDWKSTYKIDLQSETKHIRDFELPSVLGISDCGQKRYRVSLFSKQGQDVLVDFSKFQISKGVTYKIYDVENRNVILKKGMVNEDLVVEFPMNVKAIEKPLYNTTAKKTLNNFGVYFIEFEGLKQAQRKSFLTRWLKKIFS